MNTMKKYIGDGVYAEITFANALILTTENGKDVTNRVIIQPEVWRDLLPFVRDNWPYEHKRHQAELYDFLQDHEKPRRKHNPEWLSQALNESDGTYKP